MSADGWRQLVDLDRLRGWMDACGLEAGPIVDPTALAGGTQNVLVRFRRGDRHFVLRRPPSHPYMDGSATSGARLGCSRRSPTLMFPTRASFAPAAQMTSSAPPFI